MLNQCQTVLASLLALPLASQGLEVCGACHALLVVEAISVTPDGAKDAGCVVAGHAALKAGVEGVSNTPLNRARDVIFAPRSMHARDAHLASCDQQPAARSKKRSKTHLLRFTACEIASIDKHHAPRRTRRCAHAATLAAARSLHDTAPSRIARTSMRAPQALAGRPACVTQPPGRLPRAPGGGGDLHWPRQYEERHTCTCACYISCA